MRVLRRLDLPYIVDVDDATGFTINFAYMLTDRWSVELLAAYPYKHDIHLKGTSIKVGETKHLPPTLSIQYHLNPTGAFQPYVGAGVNYTTAQGGAALANFVLVVAILGAFVTAFYMTRAVSLTFFGSYKGHGHPHESPKIMTYPLIGLAFFSVVAGWINIPGITDFFTKGTEARFLAPGDHHAESINFGLAGLGGLGLEGDLLLGWRAGDAIRAELS